MNPFGNMDFEEIAEVKADSKHRISLGKKIKHLARHYRVYEDRMTGKILLEPLATLPLSDHWLDHYPEAKASVERGLADAKAGRLTDAPEDFSKYIDKE